MRRIYHRSIYWISVLVLSMTHNASTLSAQPGQVTYSRVEMMPNEPSPYNLRDWRDVAIKYDQFVFDSTKTGEHLPFVFMVANGTSYPERRTFGLHTYVGTNNPASGEGINVLPALVGASLSGIDKTDHYGQNWVLMAQDYFNINPSEGIYLNNRGGKSGNDWWYDMMPNIFFYQLYDLYGEIGDAEFQFSSVANQMLESVRHMEGSDTPWNRAYMNYRAWRFSTMTPNTDGVEEPEAAGAYAWLLYHAYHQIGDPEYLKGAEWSMEYLNALGSNPSYELQLPYGAYIAARMNAELNTAYDIEKLVYWVFYRGPIRGWGTIVGEWGGLDVSGLVGEANDGGNDYAFQMNGVQQAAALVPLVRYDKRFARTIGKWMLNVANATRLMYPGFLPASLQDASDWSETYDTDRVIGYEALREVWEGKSPFSTGDAVKGGWAATNLALYGSSSIGYLGSLIETTNQDKILLIDLLKTDFFKDEAYPSYLLFNPFSDTRSVTIACGDEPVDIYDVLTEEFIAESVTGDTDIPIPGDQARSIVLAPAGGTITFDVNRMLIDDVIVDYSQSRQAWNAPPRIKALAVQDTSVERGDTINIYGTSQDLETKDPVFEWYAASGEIIGDGETVEWAAPDSIGQHRIMLVVHDEDSQTDTAYLTLRTVDEVNIGPVIESVVPSSSYTDPGGQIDITCNAFDENGDDLDYSWSSTTGTISGTGPTVTWTAPSVNSIATITVRVSDTDNASDDSQIRLLAYEFVNNNADLIASYPFNGNADDVSGNAHHGTVEGAKLTSDRNGMPSSAYFFDGANDHISAENTDLLNFSEGITVSCWVTPDNLPPRESFILSHGSWQNRWKLSVIPGNQVRWTLKTSDNVIRDLDSETELVPDEWFHIAASYDGEVFLIYINGCLETFTTLNGSINSTIHGLEIGQMLPDDAGFNFRGTIDDVLIFDHALHPDTIALLAEKQPSSVGHFSRPLPLTLYPNPARGTLNITLPDNHGPAQP